jgi:peptide/nickel transport system permease protein
VLTFVVRRLLGLVAVMFVLSILVFLIFFETPGVDPARLMAGRNPSPQTIANIRHEFGLDRPLPVRYALMMKRMFITRDLISYGSHTKVIPEILHATR